MKKKLIAVTALLVMVLIAAYSAFDRFFPKAAAINPPDMEIVNSVSIVRNDGSSVYVTKAESEDVLRNIAKAQPTRKMSVNDRPVAEVYYFIEVVESVGEYRCFVYMEGSQAYIEIPYVGIYRTDNQFFHTIEGYFMEN